MTTIKNYADKKKEKKSTVTNMQSATLHYHIDSQNSFFKILDKGEFQLNYI